MPLIQLPDAEELESLEPFTGVPQERIFVPLTPEEFEIAARKLSRHPVLGFDTETRPTFVKGLSTGGPHIVQLATTEYVVIFQLFRRGCRDAVARVLESEEIAKVGFGLQTDVSELRRLPGIQARCIVDLGTFLRCETHTGNVGTRDAVAAVLRTRFFKSKRIRTSNWAAPYLSDRQLLYAANDAYAALSVFWALSESQRIEALEGAVHGGGAGTSQYP